MSVGRGRVGLPTNQMSAVELEPEDEDGPWIPQMWMVVLCEALELPVDRPSWFSHPTMGSDQRHLSCGAARIQWSQCW